MSLLLDALKRAEQEKSARDAMPAPSSGPAGPAARVAANSANLELQPLSSANAGAPAQRAGEAHGAQSLFEAKAAANRAADMRARGPLLAAIGAIAVIVLAAGAYVWFSIQSLSPRTPVASAAPRPPAAPTPQPASGAPFTPLSAPPPLAAAAAGAPTSATVANLTPEPREAATADAAQKRALDMLRRPAASAAPTQPAEPPVQLERSVPRASIAPGVSQGYDALRRGDLTEARRGYEGALGAEPASVDALLGLATIEARLGRPSAAAPHYRRVLQLDPRNATALAGLAALSDYSRPDDLETQLRADLARYPNSAPLHVTLGNLYASQARWKEAQNEYFEAHRLQPASADTLYNLAVSLDHLGQGRVAAEYYARALDSARGQSAQFDPARVSRRLAELKP